MREVRVGVERPRRAVGAEAKTGINTALTAGVVLGAGETTGPGEALTRDRRSD